jgi:hypothetical protein
VLDRDRLAPYHDEPERFDNRYVVTLPSADALRSRGVQRVLYVVPAGSEPREIDDLNARFVEYRQAGIEVRMLGLGDLTLGEPLSDPQRPNARTEPRYYWHGTPATHWWFWNHYGWRSSASGIEPQQPTRESFGGTWSPTRRPTMVDGGLARIGHARFERTDPDPARPGSGGSYGRSSGWYGG